MRYKIGDKVFVLKKGLRKGNIIEIIERKDSIKYGVDDIGFGLTFFTEILGLQTSENENKIEEAEKMIDIVEEEIDVFIKKKEGILLNNLKKLFKDKAFEQ